MLLAFLLMGFQARTIIDSMAPERLREAAWFALVMVLTLVLVRMAWVLFYNRRAFRFRTLRGDSPPATLRQGVLVGWCGMRRLVTLATAFALPPVPEARPHRTHRFRRRDGDSGPARTNPLACGASAGTWR